MRKIIQIIPYVEGQEGSTETTFFALCDDGTIWIEHYYQSVDSPHTKRSWKLFEIEEIPQDNLTKETI